MSRRNHKPKRSKRYVPKHVHIPVLRGLRDEFGFVLHASLAAAEAGHFSKDHYDRIGGLLNTLWGAMELRPPKEASVKLVIEGAMRAMNQAGSRGDITGVWELRDLEQAAILAGIQKAEEYLPRMDVLTLYESISRFKVMQIEEEQLKFIGIDHAICDDSAVSVEFSHGQITKITQLERIAA